jgi:hypothetical protein
MTCAELALPAPLLELRSENISFLLLLARVWRRFRCFNVPNVSAALQSTLPPNTDLDSALIMFKLPHVLSVLDEVSTLLLRRFVDRRGDALASMIRKSVEAPNWMKAKEPRDVRLVMELIAQDVMSLSRMMREIDTEQDADVVGGSGKSHRQRQLVIVRPPQPAFNRGAIIDSCLWRLLKTFLECIRLHTFSRAGYQQLQVRLQRTPSITTANP